MCFETIASIATIFIALCALGVSIWQGNETRKNYRLSVTPHIDIYVVWKFVFIHSVIREGYDFRMIILEKTGKF